MLPLGPAATEGPLIRWEGEVLTVRGIYTMELRTDGWAQLSIDGTMVVNQCNHIFDTAEMTRADRVTLDAGWHKVRLDSQSSGGRGGMEWLWTRPDGVREVVPPSALRLGPDVSPDKVLQWPDLPTANICPNTP